MGTGKQRQKIAVIYLNAPSTDVISLTAINSEDRAITIKNVFYEKLV
jgi:hypothetical protein